MVNFVWCFQEVKVHEKIKSTLSEIDQLKKLTKKEMNENQRLTLNKTRVEMDISSCKQQLDEEMAKYNEHARNIVEMQTIIGTFRNCK